MGCDGGTIPRRDELVRVKQKPEQKDKDAEREFRWRHCTLTQQSLQEPIAMCGMGRLYSKQSVIERLLEKEPMPETAAHVKSMKDIRQLNPTPNPAFTEEDKTEGLLDTRHAPYICKLIGLEMSGKFRFVALWSCGCVMSERALKQIKGSVASTCPLCQAPYSVEDVVVLNGNDEDLELMRVKMEMRAAKRKSSKKDKKGAKKVEVKAEPAEPEEPVASTSKSAPVEKPTTSTKIKAVAQVKRLGAVNAMQDPELKRLKSDFSVAKDPKASDVYKSLFTSHKTEKDQERAHWVTYNPFYN
ncbi:replication termination factor 2 [Drosophila santomea]|uniref:replication termination factor 2 n=1 Tax=Drosophila santomea TaxID=129105 RepID=UPI001954B919|nr:replication termination factor 2 [Drosophila santomea]XP_039499127.1 replication termination factor 2 [Drosophila santomea]XP_039499136.1 replication termination factor 2 [Drosophila santomea]XP_039499145.1 replication termination factor 2 [Drosophila santomea]